MKWHGKHFSLFSEPIDYGIQITTTGKEKRFFYVTSAAQQMRWLKAFERQLNRQVSLREEGSWKKTYPTIERPINPLAVYRRKKQLLRVQLDQIPFPYASVLLYLNISDLFSLESTCKIMQINIRNSAMYKWALYHGSIDVERIIFVFGRFCNANRTMPSMKIRKEIRRVWGERIRTDVERTYGSLPPHRRTSALSQSQRYSSVEENESRVELLYEVLLSLATRYPDVGYCQALDSIVAFCAELLQYRKQPIFVLMCRLFEGDGLQEAFAPGMEVLRLRCFQMDELIAHYFPRLDNHFKREGVSSDMYCISWFQTLFIYAEAIPNELVVQIWTIFVYQKSWKIIIRIALAIVHQCSEYFQTTFIEGIMR